MISGVHPHRSLALPDPFQQRPHKLMAALTMADGVEQTRGDYIQTVCRKPAGHVELPALCAAVIRKRMWGVCLG
jgi:hypothetical protein